MMHLKTYADATGWPIAKVYEHYQMTIASGLKPCFVDHKPNDDHIEGIERMLSTVN